ncbi:MAG: DUF1624 domain-containing protein [Saprospiraceae bacterium]|jgi:uncharacterized membrane protein|nr:DUF1624 domain-containing protein [Saprospiraceae bacterium]
MTAISKPRIESIDLLKGLAMIVMALDHVRDYFHYDSFMFDPSDPLQSTLPIFFTRFITHFCAPAFAFLAGTSAFMVGKRKSKKELSVFLFKRGLWLVFIEMTIVNFAWFFDIYFRSPGLLVIWSLGISMIVLAALVHFSKYFILAFSVILIFGHNLLDNFHMGGRMFWSVIHERNIFKISDDVNFYIEYPLIPWIAVMSLGYFFGTYYEPSFDPNKRKKSFNIIGIAAISIFIILRSFNIYGESIPFDDNGMFSQTLMSFLQLTKYPPSLLYLLVTLGAAFLFLANTENVRGKVVNFFCTFGRVPFFYYIIHLFLIHIVAMVFAQFSGLGWQAMILPEWSMPKGFGYSLLVVYMVWIGIIISLYPSCKWFDTYKQAHKEKWWLSYL